MDDIWHNLHITDKTGQVFFNTTASPMATASEIKKLKHQINFAKQHPGACNFLDVETAVLMLDGEPYGTLDDILDDDLLKELGL